MRVRKKLKGAFENGKCSWWFQSIRNCGWSLRRQKQKCSRYHFSSSLHLDLEKTDFSSIPFYLHKESISNVFYCVWVGNVRNGEWRQKARKKDFSPSLVGHSFRWVEHWTQFLAAWITFQWLLMMLSLLLMMPVLSLLL